MPKWTRERIIREILRREAEGLPLTSSRVNAGVDHALYQAASRFFGSWRNAIVASGLPPTCARSNSDWTPARILTVIRALARRRTRLCAHEVRQRYGQLIPAARRCFGSWSKAVYAAGVDPHKVQRMSIWTREKVIEDILVRAIRNEPLQRQLVRPQALADAGTRLFGSWKEAIAAAGIEPAAVSRAISSAGGQRRSSLEGALCDKEPSEGEHRRGARWSKDEIMQAMIRRYQNDKPINAAAVDEDQRPLYRAGLRYFGSWKNALVAAGLPIQVSRKRPVWRAGNHPDVDDGTID